MKRLLITMLLLTVWCVAAFSAEDEAKKAELEIARQEVERICLSMKPFLERPDNLNQVKIDASDEINAYADSDNNVTFLMGMLNFVRDENELAAVCGHELAHLSAKHIKRSLFTRIVATVASEAIGGTAGDLAGTALYSKQSRKHEREADSRGLLYMWQAGYDPRCVWKFWQSINNKYQQGDDALSKYLGTHPVNEERIENLKVLLVRNCQTYPHLPYCDEILNDQELVRIFNQFESRD